MTIGYDYREFAVLFVDDEEKARKYFRMAFEQDFQVLTAADVEEACEVVASGKPAVGILITDQRMPREVGTELLARVRRAHPDIVRMLTTAFADLDTVIEAVNSGAIYKYIVKPWDVRELRITLRRAMEYFVLRRERDLLLREKLSSLQQLLITDRVRSLAVLAEGISTHVRDTMIALQAYIELAKEESQARLPHFAVAAEQSWRNVREETEEANRHMLKVIHGLAEATLERRYEFSDSVRLSEVIESAWSSARAVVSPSSAGLRLDLAPQLPEVVCCRAMLTRMFSNLFRQVARGEPAAGPDDEHFVDVVARDTTLVWGAESVVIDVLRHGFTWSDQSLSSLFMPLGVLTDDDQPDLLAAFFIAYHHGGTIRLNREQPACSGFRLTLPFSPDKVTRPGLDTNAVDELFLRLPAWEMLERGA